VPKWSASVWIEIHMT